MKTYYKSQIVPSNQGTTVYWVEDERGKARDIRREDIPKDAEIVDADAMIAARGK